MPWNKCSEKMPQLNQWVLVCNPLENCVDIRRWNGSFWEKVGPYNDSPTFTNEMGYMRSEEIINWTELPNPPEECQNHLWSWMPNDKKICLNCGIEKE